jgi:hypothetical protein
MILQTEPAKRGPGQDPDPEPRYSYWAVAVKARDAQSRITAFETWFVQCGPPRRQDPRTPNRSAHRGTRHPLPGLRMDGENCLATEPEAVRQAARASRAWAGDISRSIWVRDARAADIAPDDAAAAPER